MERGIPTMLCPSVTSSDSPCAIPSVPSVVMNGGMSNTAISTPLPNPKHNPTASAAKKPSVSEPVAITVTASTMEAKVSTAPIDRSRPSVMMMTVIGSASSNRIVDWVRIFEILADFDAAIVFVGYGIHAPEYHWDDYAGADGKEIDLKGKIALVIVNEPPSNDEKFFKGPALTYYGRWTYKYEEAARRGAVGVLIIHRTDLASYGWEVVRNSQAVEKSYLQGDPDATLRAAAWIQHDVAQHLFTLAGLGDLDQAIDTAGRPGAFHAVELPVKLKGHVESRVRRYVSA